MAFPLNKIYIEIEGGLISGVYACTARLGEVEVVQVDHDVQDDEAEQNLNEKVAELEEAKAAGYVDVS
jgi:hypothetical protein